jgi:predicted DNA-binding ribbon-helix-helix protein
VSQQQPDRRRGRPRVPDPGSAVSTRLPTSIYDRLIALANRREVSVSALIRKMVIVQVNKTP